MPASLIGKKVGMSQVYTDEGRIVPVTIIEAGPCHVMQVKAADGPDGYDALQLGFGMRKRNRANKPLMGHCQKAKGEPAQYLREVPLPDGGAPELGATLTVNVFGEVAEVDVTGTSRGKGFAGVMKRWGFAGGPASHGCSKRHRSPGSIGCAATPDKAVLKGKKMPGHMGSRRRTVRNLQVIGIDEERSLLLVKGGVPGAPGTFLSIRESKVSKR